MGINKCDLCGKQIATEDIKVVGVVINSNLSARDKAFRLCSDFCVIALEKALSKEIEDFIAMAQLGTWANHKKWHVVMVKK